MSSRDFTNGYVAAKGLPDFVKALGWGVRGCEIGVSWGETLLFMLQECPNIEKMVAIDNFQPYEDYIGTMGTEFEGTPAWVTTPLNMKRVHDTCMDNIAASNQAHRIDFIINNSEDVVGDFDDGYFDYIFLDAYLTYEQTKRDLEQWYPKVRDGGLFSGHDWHGAEVQKAVNEFREENNIKETLRIVHDGCWFWYKNKEI